MTTPTVIAALIDAANEIERLGGDPSHFHKVAFEAVQPAAAEPTAPQQEASAAHHLTDAQIIGLQEVALSIFNVPGAPQETRDVIEWFIGMLRVQAEGASRAAAQVGQPVASNVPALDNFIADFEQVHGKGEA